MVYLGKARTKDMHIGAKSELFMLAKDHGNNPTVSERILWEHLRKFRSDGFVFRRQHPIDLFIADFYCHKIKLAIEIDGEYHSNDQSLEYDDNRTGELERFGICIIRFKNEEVINNCEAVLSKIRFKIDELTSPALSGSGGQERVRPTMASDK
jgi:very-short-patch-repair endonuclease